MQLSVPLFLCFGVEQDPYLLAYHFQEDCFYIISFAYLGTNSDFIEDKLFYLQSSSEHLQPKDESKSYYLSKRLLLRLYC
jgi:hypothetical protein